MVWLGWIWRDGNFGGSGLQPHVELMQIFEHTEHGRNSEYGFIGR
jgi:hypothetical protein